MLRNDTESWKAACLLSKLSNKFPNVKKSFQLSTIKKIRSSLINILKNVKHYTLACYLVEFLSHLDHSSIKEIFPKGFPMGSIANDTKCQEFLRDQSILATNIVKFKSFSINNDLVISGSSVVQANNDHLLVLCEINSSASPFQIDFDTVCSTTRKRNELKINLSKPPKETIMSSWNFTDTILVTLEFYSNENLEMVLDKINSSIVDASTPLRKISVAKGFIALNTQHEDLYETEEEKELEEPYKFNQMQRSEGESEIIQATQDSEINESPSLFHSPTNTTKDTSYSNKKHSRTISFIVAESTRAHQEDIKLDTEPSQQLIIESSQVEPAQKQLKTEKKGFNKAAPKRKTTLEDIWDFISDGSDADNDTRTTKKSKSLKCLPTLPDKKNIDATKTSVSSKEIVQSQKQAGLKVTKNDTRQIPQAQLSSLDIDATFSGLTSPTVNAKVRANTRAGTNAAFQKQTAKAANNMRSDHKDQKPKGTNLTNDFRSNFDSDPIEEDEDNISNYSDTINERELQCGQKSTTIEKNETKEIIKETKKVVELTTGKRKRKANKGKEELPKTKKANIHPHNVKKLNEPQSITTPISRINPSGISLLSADNLLSEAYTTTLQKQIFHSITTFSNQLVNKIQIINGAINKKVMADLTNKYETLFSGLRDSFQNDVDEISSFIGDVKGMLNLSEEELVEYINDRKFGLTKEG